MSVCRVEKNRDYTIMSNHHLKNRQLTLKAKGLLSLVLSLPDSWDYTVAGLCAICLENKTAVESALKELKNAGYLVVVKKLPNSTNSGRYEYEYIFYENPMDTLKQGIENQGIENQGVEFQGIENQAQLNTKKTNTKKTNTKKDKYAKISKILESKFLEYQINEQVGEKLDEFITTLLDNGKLVTEQKIDSILMSLVRVDVETQLKAIQLSLDRGYINIDPAWLTPCKKLPENLSLGCDKQENRKEYLQDTKNNGYVF